MNGELSVTSDQSSGGMVRYLLNKEGRKGATVFACFEDLTFGPLVDTRTPEQLLRLRHRYWCKARIVEPGVRPPERRTLRKLLLAAEHVEIMVAGEGREQLFLLGLASLLRQTARQVRVVQLFQYPSKQRWESLGMLNLDALAKRPEPKLVDGALLAQMEDVWQIVISGSPHALFELRGRLAEMETLPFLYRAIDDLISSYPRIDTGLTLAQERLLKAAPNSWTEAARVVGSAMIGDDIDGRSFGDNILFAYLVEMAEQRQPNPPVELRGDLRRMRACEARITDFGAACLRGEANHASVNGINSWAAGVHLNSAEGRVWFRNPENTLAEY